MTDIWSSKNEDKALPPAKGGGWNKQQIQTLHDELPENDNNFDAIILNYNNSIMPPAQEFNRMTIERGCGDSIHFAYEHFKAKSVILVTYPFTRRVNSTHLWTNLSVLNEILRQMSAENNRNTTSHVTTTVFEFGNLTNQLLWSNALGVLV